MSDTLYLKDGRKYKPVAFIPPYAIWPGIWLVQRGPGFESKKSLEWSCKLMADVKRPVDVVALASLMTMQDGLAAHIVKMRESRSGVSAADLAEECLAWISQNLKS